MNNYVWVLTVCKTYTDDLSDIDTEIYKTKEKAIEHLNKCYNPSDYYYGWNECEYEESSEWIYHHYVNIDDGSEAIFSIQKHYIDK